MHDDSMAALPGQPVSPDGAPQPFSLALLRIGQALMGLSAAGLCLALAGRLVLPKGGSLPSALFAVCVVSGWLLLLGSVLTVSSGVAGRVRTLARLVLAATATYLVGRLVLG